MQTNSFSWDRFDALPIVGIIRNLPFETILQLAESYHLAGFTNLEITMNTPNAIECIHELSQLYPDLNIGAGTVCTMKDWNKAIEAGSQFIVTPVLQEEVIRQTVELGIPIFPGAFTPTEVFRAWDLGAAAVKVFPVTQLGPTYIKDILAPLNHIRLLPTGGVTEKNIEAYFQAGAYGVGMGSGLFDRQMIANQDFVGLQQHFIEIKKNLLE